MKKKSSRLRPVSLILSSLLFLATGGCRSSSIGDDECEYSDKCSTASHDNDADPDYDRVFSTDVVHRIDITLTPENFATLERDKTVLHSEFGITPVWTEASIEYDGFLWEHVGIRYRDTWAIERAVEDNNGKVPFKLSFDKFEAEETRTKNQRFYGFKKLVFVTHQKDDSLLHEVLAGELFREVGVPSARSAFYEVHVDAGEGSEYWGLYTALEDPDDVAMQEAQLGGDGGNLYKPGGPNATWEAFDEGSFDKTNYVEVADYSDVKASVEALHHEEADRSLWRTQLEETFDVNSFLRWLAVNTLLVNGESYGCEDKNYYLYGRVNNGGKLTWFPTDLNETFLGSVVSCGSNDADAAADVEADIFHVNLKKEMPLISTLLADEEYKKRYTEFLSEALIAFERTKFEERAQSLHQMIAPSVVGDKGENPTHTDLDSAESFNRSLDGESGLFAHGQQRRELVEQAILSQQ